MALGCQRKRWRASGEQEEMARVWRDGGQVSQVVVVKKLIKEMKNSRLRGVVSRARHNRTRETIMRALARDASLRVCARCCEGAVTREDGLAAGGRALRRRPGAYECGHDASQHQIYRAD